MARHRKQRAVNGVYHELMCTCYDKDMGMVSSLKVQDVIVALHKKHDPEGNSVMSMMPRTTRHRIETDEVIVTRLAELLETIQHARQEEYKMAFQVICAAVAGTEGDKDDHTTITSRLKIRGHKGTTYHQSVPRRAYFDEQKKLSGKYGSSLHQTLD